MPSTHPRATIAPWAFVPVANAVKLDAPTCTVEFLEPGTLEKAIVSVGVGEALRSEAHVGSEPAGPT